MSVQTEITRIAGRIADSYAACDELGGTLPATQNSNNLADCIRTIPAGPQFTYTGTYEFTDEGNDNWTLKLLTSGTLNFSYLGTNIDMFMVGGGAGGGSGRYQSTLTTSNKYFGGYGGGSGYTRSIGDISVTVGTDYAIVIAAGGAAGSSSGAGGTGGTTSAFSYSCQGGYSAGPFESDCPSGGSGGGKRGYQGRSGYSGGTDGYADNTYEDFGLGQRYTQVYPGETSTRAFYSLDADVNKTMYAAGGAGGTSVSSVVGADGEANTGNGGEGAGRTANGGAGGSGIIILRDHRS